MTFGQRGFTLLEVLVAMAVFAIAASALMYGVNESLRAQTRMQDQTLAHYVALNQIALTRLQAKWPSVGISNGSEEMAGTEWFWQRNVSQTSDPKLRRVDIEVRLDPQVESALARLTAFVSQEPIKLAAPAESNLDTGGDMRIPEEKDPVTPPLENEGDVGEPQP